MAALLDSEENAVLEQLSSLSLESKTYSHAAAFTVEEQTKEIAHLEGRMTKNLFLKDKKHGLFLVTAGFNREVNMKTVQTMLGLGGANLRFGDETLLQDTLGVIKGSVSPFAMMNDKEKKVRETLRLMSLSRFSYGLSIFIFQSAFAVVQGAILSLGFFGNETFWPIET